MRQVVLDPSWSALCQRPPTLQNYGQLEIIFHILEVGISKGVWLFVNVQNGASVWSLFGGNDVVWFTNRHV